MKIKLKLNLFLILTVILCSFSYSQNIGINTETPDPSAMLHIESNNMGLLIPKLNISNLSSASPVTNPAVGLLVYNTNTSTGPGFFFWSGTSWVSLFSKVDFDNTPAGGISSTNISNWNTAYSWGNHASAGYAPSSHTHDASHIVSGTLSVPRGGTGLSSYTTGGYIYASGPTTLAQKTPAQVLTDIGAAPSSHTHATLSVGSYLTGGNYDGSTARTWAVDATSANTANKIIARDANGAFSAGIIFSDNLYVYNSGSTGWAGFTSYRNAATGNGASDGSAVGINGTDLWINNYENSRIFFGTQNTSRMVILGDGKVGIGTDAPTQKLDVGGNIRTSGQLYTTGSASNYGAISIYGTKNNYGGINFRDGSGNNIATLMIHSQYQGIYNSGDNGWLWYWNNGTLEAGTVPVARISGLGNSATLNVGTTSGTVAAGDHTHANLTRGSYLTGSNYNGSTATTWAVDATTTNSANKIVARDGSGDIYFRYGFSEYLNMSHAATTRNTDNVFFSSNDNYIRKNTAEGFRASLGIPTIKKASVVMTITPNAWNLVTHNLNISSNLNWYAIATNGDQSANNFNIVRSPNWNNANQCWVYIEGGVAGNGRINIIVFE